MIDMVSPYFAGQDAFYIMIPVTMGRIKIILDMNFVVCNVFALCEECFRELGMTSVDAPVD